MRGEVKFDVRELRRACCFKVAQRALLGDIQSDFAINREVGESCATQTLGDVIFRTFDLTVHFVIDRATCHDGV